MAKQLRPEIAATSLPKAARSLVDQEVARWLAERVAEDSRLAFARSFAGTVVQQCWRARGLPSRPQAFPHDMERLALSLEAAAVADRLGTEISQLEPLTIAQSVGCIYTSMLPDAYRGSHGIFYTPPELAERLLDMAEEGGIDWRKARVLDPACGGGAFLLPTAVRMIEALTGTDPALLLHQLRARLRGFDIDPFGAWLAQAMVEILLQTLVQSANRSAPLLIDRRDSLDLKAEDSEIYDLVIGNPPYGRVSLSAARRSVFRRGVYGHANLYGLFTDAALRWVKQGGIVAYVTPTSMLSGLYYKSLRTLLVTEAPPLAVNFVSKREGVFANVLQETMLTTYRRGGLAHGGAVGFIDLEQGQRAHVRKAGIIALSSRPEAPWLLPRSDRQAALTKRLRSMPHRLAHYGYSVSTGPLVWNRFKEQFRDKPDARTFPVIWAESVTSDGRFVWQSERRNHRPWFTANRPKDDWLIVNQPCVLLQRTTAKEQARRLIAAELPRNFIRRHKGVAVENHLNMIRTNAPKPTVPAAVIAALFNSKAVDDAFRCINGSVAVSAFEIEELPLPSPRVMTQLSNLIKTRAPVAKIEAVIAAAYTRAHAPAAG